VTRRGRGAAGCDGGAPRDGGRHPGTDQLAGRRIDVEATSSQVQPRVQPLPASAWLYIVAVWTVAFFLTVTRLSELRSISWPDLLIFIVATIAAEIWYVTTGPKSAMSLSFPLHYAAAVLLGPAAAAVIAATSLLCSDGVIRRRPMSKTLFNAASFAVSAAVCGIVFQSLHVGTTIRLTSDALALVGAAFAYLIVNDTLVAVVVRLMGGNFLNEWLSAFRDVGIPYVSMAPLGALIAYTYQSSPWTLLYYLPLVLVIYNGFKLFVTLQRETDDALVALADSIDKRDPYTYEHSARVAACAGEIAELMHVPSEDVEVVVAAARVHDLGKIASDNRVLLKPTKLSPEERKSIAAHPADGADLAGNFSMFRKGSSCIRHHHERWDGEGYPDGLAGRDIPLGARVIAVADAYDAMTSDRPYRKALPHETALAELEHGAGTQFDPDVVCAFISHQRCRPSTKHAVPSGQESCSSSYSR
jgi:putative nucleotidyltransferase with HDIG domain